MAKRFIFSMSAAGAWDGTTLFQMPSPLPDPDPNTGWTTIPMTSGGRIDPDSLARSIGVGGAKVTCIGLSSTSAAARIAIGFYQPRPGIAYGTDQLFQTFELGTLIVGGFAVRPLERLSMYMPPGYVLALYADNGAGVPVVGPYQISLEFEALSGMAEIAAALRAQEFPYRPDFLG